MKQQWRTLCFDRNSDSHASSLSVITILVRGRVGNENRQCHSLDVMYRVLVLLLVLCSASCYKPREDKTKCPKVKALRNFDINELMGTWYIVEYYASSEEMPEYSCMRSAFTISLQPLGISMKFNYSFVDDPEREKLNGNITWEVPDGNQPAHWVHAEDTYEGVYNTYVLDSDYNSFGLLLHCAEKSGTERYLSSLVLSREQTLKRNIINYLREKLPRYGVDLEYMFPISQKDCDLESSVGNRRTKKKGVRKHPLKHHG
ncbi:UNVERIFIED_CONTAM: hypothetical protein PYX00_002790 [Menopon gallinae]|uniref:VDE lipocalin domain-containing protein n=1 Tax=Menopon gallinae TaxID=328185 RepID=A0AAW2HXK6_9NEOP